MTEWLIPIGIFWVMGAVFFGGLYDAEGGSAGRQLLGLLLTFAFYMLAFWLLRLALGGLLGIVGRLILPVAIPTMLIGRLGQVAFRLVGVRITRRVFSAEAH